MIGRTITAAILLFASAAQAAEPSTLLCVAIEVARVKYDNTTGESKGVESGPYALKDQSKYLKDAEGWKRLGSDDIVMPCSNEFHCALDIPGHFVLIHQSRKTFRYVKFTGEENAGKVPRELWLNVQQGTCTDLVQ